MIEIHLDENLSEYVADALNSLNKGYFRHVNVYSTKTKFGKAAKDEDIIPAIGKTKGILITKDININRKRLQFQLCKQYNLGVFFLKPAKNKDRHWETVKMLIENWEEIIATIGKDKLPFSYEVPTRGRMKRLN